MRYEYIVYTVVLLGTLLTGYFFKGKKNDESRIKQVIAQVEPQRVQSFIFESEKYRLILDQAQAVVKITNKSNQQTENVNIDEKFHSFLNHLNPLVSNSFLGEISEVRKTDLRLDQSGAKLSFGMSQESEYNFVVGRINKNDPSKRYILDLKNQNVYSIDTSVFSFLDTYF